MKHSRVSAILFLMLAVALVVSACGGGNSASPEPSSSGSAGASPSATAADKEPVTLKISSWNPLSQKVIDKFEETYPYITVEPDQIADQYREVIRTRVVSKADMDIVWMFPNQMREYVDQDVLMDMSNEAWKGNYLESAVQLGTVDGKTYGVPYNYYAVVIFYNRDVFRDLGLEVPTSWEELLDVSEKIKASGLSPFVTGGKDAWATQFMSSGQFGAYQHKDPLVFDKLASGEKKWTDPEFADFFGPLSELVDKGYFLENSVGLGNAQVVQVFKEGKAAMYPMGSWALDEFTEEFKEFEVGAFPIPLNKGGEPLVVNLISDNIFTGISWSKRQEEIKLFMEFIADPENAKLWSEDTKSAVTVVGGTSPTYHPIAAELTSSIESNISTIFPSLTPSMEPAYFPMLQQILLKQKPDLAKLMEEMQKAQEKDYK
ncbi:ABC transporter substrate-binding protein [Cohnella hongkongensis]|uniref:ABC transporter substrate-binding protein n=1 Tax=Cohnella hongkongensis TaxID=178337 RepID=A0ABV9FEI3_9BACL